MESSKIVRNNKFKPGKHVIPVVYTGFCGWGGGSRQQGGVLFYIGEIKNFAFFQTR